jgi:hypothetical protein
VRFLVRVHVKGEMEICVVCSVVMTKVRHGNWLLLRSEAEYILRRSIWDIVISTRWLTFVKTSSVEHLFAKILRGVYVSLIA